MWQISLYLFSVLFTLSFTSCYFINSSIAHRSFLVPPPKKTPTDAGLDYKVITVSYEDRTFIGWLVSAKPFPDSASNAVLMFNGLGGGVSSWVNVQKIFYENNISSLVFNYGDLRDTVEYREHTGNTTFSEIQYVIPHFFKELIASVPKNSRFFLLGHSLGCAVISQNFALLDTAKVTGVILCSQFNSLLQSGLHHGYVPKLLAPFLPNSVFNNTIHVPEIHKPLLFVHSKADSANLYIWGREVFAATPEPKTFITYEGFNHNYLYKGTDDYWQPIMKFIKQ